MVFKVHRVNKTCRTHGPRKAMVKKEKVLKARKTPGISDWYDYT